MCYFVPAFCPEKSDLKHEAVVSEVEAFGEARFLDGVQAEVVTHVDEICRHGAEAAAEGDGLFYGLVRLVRRVAQCSDDEQADAIEQRQRRVEKPCHVGEVGHIADAIPEDGQLAVHDAQGCDRERTELQAVTLLYLMQFQFRHARIAVPYQAVGETLPQVFAGIVVSIERKVAVESERPEIIDAANVVVVLVGDEDGIQRS